MDHSDNHSQLIHPQNTYKRFKTSLIRFFQRLGCRNAPDTAVRAMPSVATTPTVMQGNNFFQNAQGVNIRGRPKFQNVSVNNIYSGGIDRLEKLETFVSFDAQFDSSAQDPERQCHRGTRLNVLQRLRNWVDNPKAKERIFWLYGPAGAGKSAIAQTIARSYERPKVAASFFFFRSDVHRNNGNRLFTTLAYQLAFSLPAIRDHIGDSLYERPDLPRTGVETQFNQLIARPFQVLCEDAAQQFAPAVDVIIEIVKKHQELAPIIIIDGVDECKDEKLQERFLKAIGNAVTDTRFPLRFLIASRPELHIEKTINRFETPILSIDLSKLDDANRDIEKYLVDEFSRIASEQGLDPRWPGQNIIDNIVFKSSGNFIFAAVVIKFVGDPDNSAETQLQIVLNMKPPTTMSPFAILDQLFLEILKRVPDQVFLKRYLVLLTARMSVSGDYSDLYKDDAVLMHVSERELHAKLRKMRSLLKLKPQIDIHHRSFLDFLHDSSRSSQYCIPEPRGIRGYLEVFVDSLVRYISTVIEQAGKHNTPHFTPGLREMLIAYPLKINLPAKEWHELMQPLLGVQDRLLQLPNFISPRNFLPCDECTVFTLLRDLLHLGLHQGFHGRTFIATSIIGAKSVKNVQTRKGVISSATIDTTYMNDNDLDRVLLSLFARLPETMENVTLSKEVIDLMNTILWFDYAETAIRVRFVSEAQKLVDFLDCMIHAKNWLSPDATDKATLLAFQIFTRVPILPLSFFKFVSRNSELCYNSWIVHQPIPFQILSQTVFASRVLDRRYIVPLSGVIEGQAGISLIHEAVDGHDLTMDQWRQKVIPDSMTIIPVMHRLAKAIRYLHSMGVVLYQQLCSDDIFLDVDLRPKICCLYSISPFLLDKRYRGWFLFESNIFSFGSLFYELYSGVKIESPFSISYRKHITTCRPSIQGIPEYVWQLIQGCCAEDTKSRPTIDEVVREMESWSENGASIIQEVLKD